MRPIKRIIIHCSDSDIKAHDNIGTIRSWHLAQGWKDVGYHFFIQHNGNIERGRELSRIGAHTLGYNDDSIGICLHGKHNFSQVQFDSLRRLINTLNQEFENLGVFGHCDFDTNKTCPNFDYKKVVAGHMDNDPKTEKRV